MDRTQPGLPIKKGQHPPPRLRDDAIGQPGAVPDLVTQRLHPQRPWRSSSSLMAGSSGSSRTPTAAARRATVARMAHDPGMLLQRRLDQIKAEIASSAPCGPGQDQPPVQRVRTPGCRCKENPAQRHCPYHQLSYTWHGRSRGEFVRESELVRVQAQLRTHARLRELLDQ